MAALSVDQSVVAGLELTFNAAAGGGDTFTNDGKTIIIVKNDNAGTCTVTITTDQTIETTLGVDDRTVAVPTGEIWAIGPFSPQHYSATSTDVSLSYSVTSSVTVAVLKII